MIAIITDSTCDIPQDLIEHYDITVVSHRIMWGEEQFRDRVDLQPKAFYQRLQAEDRRPTTSQANVADFLEAIRAAAEKGAARVLILTVSSEMSGAFNRAQMAAEKAPIPTTVVDSRGPTMSLGWQVLAAARAREEGQDLPEILETVVRVRKNLVLYVGMESLEYLQTGGRIGDAVKWVGTLLKVKPLVTVNHNTGRVEPASLARTHKAMVNQLLKRFVTQFEDKVQIHVAVLHGNAPKEAQALAEKVQEALDPAELILNITGPVLGINTGPGALALSGYALS
jgi:DegV family protein with EDD domain